MESNDLDIIGKFTRICWLLHRRHHHNHRHHGPMGDPHRGQGRVLALLKLRPGISQKDLSFLLEIRPQSLGELLAKLERGGYIKRVPSDADHRILHIRLTKEGAKAAKRQDTPTEAPGNLNPDEQALLAGYLDRVIASMEREIGEEEGKEEGEMEFRGHGRGRGGCDQRMAGRMDRDCRRPDCADRFSRKCTGEHGHHDTENEECRERMRHGRRHNPREE